MRAERGDGGSSCRRTGESERAARNHRRTREPSGYEYREGAYAGPLYVLVDRGTASAAEYFAAMLKDNRAATLIGARTAGVGCGYTNGGLDVRLARSGIRVWMPDCVRLRPDGSNEADGVEPDVDAGWTEGDDGRERAARVAAALARLPR